MKKASQFLYLPLIAFVLMPIIMFFGIATMEAYILSVTIQLSVVVYGFLGGFLLSRIENKKLRITSIIFTAVLFVLLAIFTCYQCNVSDMGAWYGYLFLPATYFEYFQVNDSTVSEILLVLIAPAPVLVSVIFSKLYSVKAKWTKIVAIIIAVVLAVSGSFCIGDVVKYRSEHGIDWLGGEQYVYFDLYGNEYDSKSDVKYYDKNGNAYTLKSTDSETEDGYSITLNCLVDEKGNKTYLDGITEAYIGSDGYLYIYDFTYLDYRDDISDDEYTEWNWCDKNGNIYAEIGDVNYLKNGTPYVENGDEFKNKQ